MRAPSPAVSRLCVREPLEGAGRGAAQVGKTRGGDNGAPGGARASGEAGGG